MSLIDNIKGFVAKIKIFVARVKATWIELGFAVGFGAAFVAGLFHQWIGSAITGIIAALLFWLFILAWKDEL